jgi:hypothetical protein
MFGQATPSPGRAWELQTDRAYGFKMGDPFFRVKPQLIGHHVAVFSSNYALGTSYCCPFWAGAAIWFSVRLSAVLGFDRLAKAMALALAIHFNHSAAVCEPVPESSGHASSAEDLATVPRAGWDIASR